VSTRVDARWREIEPLLDRVLEQPASLRTVWLRSHCDDAELRRLVQSLLDADALHAEEIERQASDAEADAAEELAPLPQIPGYRVLGLIGEGGMASVFLAERVLGETVQHVALKRLRLNVYDPGERRRFEQEHRMLARLEHPGIARLLDAGIGPDGVPWFAMERVCGEPLMAWCASRGLSLDARLALFGEVCEAVHHAHQHLIVHRDLKPANLMVDATGRVRLLDFGIARLQDGSTDPGATRTGERRLTPRYAAPEQFEGHASTGTDVYALGMILVELALGHTPSGDAGAGAPRAERRDVAGATAAGRTLERLYAGDLAAIARKAMRHDPAERYGTVQALQEDVARLRAGRPVLARRGDWRYRSRLFVLRHRLAVGASVLLAAALLAATAFSMREARHASEQAERAQAVQAFVEDMLAPLRAGVPSDRMPSLDEVLGRGVQSLGRRGSHDPAVYSELLVMLARTYDRMGRIETARELAERAYAHSRTAFGEDDERTVHALAMRGRMHRRSGDQDNAKLDLEAARHAMQRQGIGGAALAMVLDDLGLLALQANSASHADALFLKAQHERVHELGDEHPDIAISYANRARAKHQLFELSGALALSQQAYQHCATFEGADTRQAAVYLGHRGFALCRVGRWREGAADYAAALAILDRVDPADHPDRLDMLTNACFDWIQLDDLDQARQNCDAAEAMAERLWGHGSAGHNRVRRYRLGFPVAAGDFELARAQARALKESIRRASGANAWALVAVDGLVSEVSRLEGDHAGMRDGQLPMLRSAILDSNFRAVSVSMLSLACHHAPATGCPGDLATEADALLDARYFREHPMRIQALLPLAQLALDRGDAVEAAARLDDIETVATLPHVRLQPDHRWLLEARLRRGDLHLLRGEPALARQEWQAAAAGLASRYGSEHPLRRQLARRMAGLGAE
jgi:hypothetical protein